MKGIESTNESPCTTSDVKHVVIDSLWKFNLSYMHHCFCELTFAMMLMLHWLFTCWMSRVPCLLFPEKHWQWEWDRWCSKLSYDRLILVKERFSFALHWCWLVNNYCECMNTSICVYLHMFVCAYVCMCLCVSTAIGICMYQGIS